MQIKAMKKKHLTQVAMLEKECFSMPWSEQALLEELELENAKLLVATEGEKVLAYAGMQLLFGEGFITNVAVFKEHRGKGIATEILKELIKLCSVSLSLEVRKSNEIAIKLYKKMNFELVGERKNFYENPVENALIFTFFI